MNLLIVDDHPTNLKLLRAQLEAEGHAVFEANDGVDALAVLERQRVDAVISDILMPRMDGYRLSHEIRKHARLRDLPIIIYSSTYTSPEDEKLALEMGAHKYLKKPASVETIIAALHEVIAMPHAAPRPDALREVEVLKNYNERLVSKLKEKNTQLQAQTETLRESQAQLQLISDNVLDLVAQIRLDSTYIYVSPSHETILGYPPQRLMGKSAFALVHPEDLERVQAAFAEAMQQGESRVEFRYRHADGRYVWVDTLGKVFIDEAGEPGGAVLRTRDITERRRAEKVVRQVSGNEVADRPLSVAKDLAVILSLSALSFVVTWKFHLFRVLLDWIATHEEMVLGEALVGLIVALLGFVWFGIRRRRETKRVEEALWKLHRELDTRVQQRTVELAQTNKKLRADIIARKRAEELLRLEDAALQAAADAIVITDRAGVIEWVNPAFSQLTGYTAEEAIGKNPWDLVKSGKHAPAFYEDLWETLLAGRVWDGEMINRRKDGSLYTEDQSVTPILDASGAITHFVAIKKDMTERLRLEAQFLQAQKMESVGRLAGGIAHDFNNLLTVINGTAELALMDLKEDAPVRSDIQEIKQAGARAALLTRQLLAFSRKQTMKFEVLNLSMLIADLQDMLQRLIREDIALVVMPAKNVGSVMADPRQMEQVIMNLTVNAGDAMPDGGTLTIETRDVALDETFAAEHPTVQPGPHVMLAVSDTGVGMEEATRRQIFEPFFTTKEPGKGTGLGLSTVYGIIKQSGGSIWVYSELGKGTTFKIYLPRSNSDVPLQVFSPVISAPVKRALETVLLVEDDDGVRKLSKHILSKAGYRVLEAANGDDAERLFVQYADSIDLVVTDVIMPGCGGPELLTRLRIRAPALRALYMSGYADESTAQKVGIDRGVPFVQKPYTATEFVRQVREALDR